MAVHFIFLFLTSLPHAMHRSAMQQTARKLGPRVTHLLEPLSARAFLRFYGTSAGIGDEGVKRTWSTDTWKFCKVTRSLSSCLTGPFIHKHFIQMFLKNSLFVSCVWLLKCPSKSSGRQITSTIRVNFDEVMAEVWEFANQTIPKNALE